MYTGKCPQCNEEARVAILPIKPEKLMVNSTMDVKCPCGQAYQLTYESPGNYEDVK